MADADMKIVIGIDIDQSLNEKTIRALWDRQRMILEQMEIHRDMWSGEFDSYADGPIRFKKSNNAPKSEPKIEPAPGPRKIIL